jgi:hypothetical protein
MQLARIAENSADLTAFLTGVTDEVRDITASEKAQGDLKFSQSSGTANIAPKKKQASQTYPCPTEECDGRLRRMVVRTTPRDAVRYGQIREVSPANSKRRARRPVHLSKTLQESGKPAQIVRKGRSSFDH